MKKLWCGFKKSKFYFTSTRFIKFDESPVRAVDLFIIACCAKIHLMYTGNNVIMFQAEYLGGGFEVIRTYLHNLYIKAQIAYPDPIYQTFYKPVAFSFNFHGHSVPGSSSKIKSNYSFYMYNSFFTLHYIICNYIIHV